MFGSWTQTLVIGSDRYSANAPGRFTPIPLVSLQRCRRPARQLRQRPQTTCPSPLTISPTWKSLTFEPTSTISPTNSCPTTIGTGIVCFAQASQVSMCTSVPQIPVRSTLISTSLIPIRGHRHLVEPKAGLGLFLHEGQHRLHVANFLQLLFDGKSAAIRAKHLAAHSIYVEG